MVTTFTVDAAPVNLPAPIDTALGPTPVEAGYCASNAAFSGRLTGSASSTTALSRVTSPTVYGYISNVQSAWSCTSFFRYSGITWNTTSTLGTFQWGNLINSTGVSCNYVVGSTDYVKGNGTTDCPDTDAEYALSATLGAQGVYQRDLAPRQRGRLQLRPDRLWRPTTVRIVDDRPGRPTRPTITANRPNGANCDPIDIDDTNTTQTITYDSTAPTVAITAPGAGPLYYRTYTSYTPTFNPSDNVAGFGGSYPWYFQRQTAPISAAGACSATWTVENTVTGTAQGSQNGASVTLTNGLCYRWKLTATDQNGNGPNSVYSGAMLIDRTAPVVDFTTPNESTTTTQNTTGYSVAWTETETQSGVATRSLQRQRVAATSSACPGTFTNDGSAVRRAAPPRRPDPDHRLLLPVDPDDHRRRRQHRDQDVGQGLRRRVQPGDELHDPQRGHDDPPGDHELHRRLDRDRRARAPSPAAHCSARRVDRHRQHVCGRDLGERRLRRAPARRRSTSTGLLGGYLLPLGPDA